MHRNIRKEILERLDQYPAAHGMPGFEEGAWYTNDCRLRAYRSNNEWAITIDVQTFSPAARGHRGVMAVLYAYGNCIRARSVLRNTIAFIARSADGPEGPTFVLRKKPWWEYVSPNARTVTIGRETVPIELDPEAYEEMGIALLEYPRIKGHEMLRGLPRAYRRQLMCSEQEIREAFRNGNTPPCVLELDEWFHPNLTIGERPSDCETFQQIAEVLASGDPGLYQPTKVPNTHWSNWPNAGFLERPTNDEYLNPPKE